MQCLSKNKYSKYTHHLLFPQEENDVGEFFLSLDKDPQQEEFLQGRMQGNPYPSSTPGLGPLMRDVKNKICTGKPGKFYAKLNVSMVTKLVLCVFAV